MQATDTTVETLQGVDSLADNPDLQRDNIDEAVKALGIYGVCFLNPFLYPKSFDSCF